MTAAELAEWQAYYQIEPFGAEWRRTASTCAMIGNAAGGRKGKAFSPDDFLPVKPLLRHTAKRQTPQQMLSIFRLMAVQK